MDEDSHLRINEKGRLSGRYIIDLPAAGVTGCLGTRNAYRFALESPSDASRWGYFKILFESINSGVI